MATPEHAVRCLKADRGGGVWLIERPGQSRRVLKRWRLTPAMALKLAMGIAQPQRQRRGERRLTRAGIGCAPVVRGVHTVWPPAVELELAWVEGRPALEVLEDPSLDAQELRRAAAAVGGLVAQLVRAGLFYRDVKLSNLIMAPAGGDWSVRVIDSVDVQAMRRPADQIVRMLERLIVLPAYRGITIPPAVWMPLLRRALAPLSRRQRREVVRTLRARPPLEFD